MSVSSPKFDLARFRELLITAIIMHDLPLQFVEYVGIQAIFAYLSDGVKHITSNTAKAEMIKMHKREKERMTSMLNLAPGQTSLTSSSWTSITTDGHMCLTAQFIDRNLVLHKRVLNFCFMPPPYNDISLSNKFKKVIYEWGIENRVFSMPLDNADNASSNDVSVDRLRTFFDYKESTCVMVSFFIFVVGLVFSIC